MYEGKFIAELAKMKKQSKQLKKVLQIQMKQKTSSQSIDKIILETENY